MFVEEKQIAQWPKTWKCTYRYIEYYPDQKPWVIRNALELYADLASHFATVKLLMVRKKCGDKSYSVLFQSMK